MQLFSLMRLCSLVSGRFKSITCSFERVLNLTEIPEGCEMKEVQTNAIYFSSVIQRHLNFVRFPLFSEKKKSLQQSKCSILARARITITVFSLKKVCIVKLE